MIDHPLELELKLGDPHAYGFPRSHPNWGFRHALRVLTKAVADLRACGFIS